MRRVQRYATRVFQGLTAFTLIAGLATATSAQAKEQKMAKPPRGAIVLFDGKDTSAWIHRGSGEPCGWKVEDGAMVVTPGKPDILTRQEFGDFQLHLEFNVPVMPDAKSQAKGNSGVYMHGRYEIQILDSFNNETYPAGQCGALYGQKEPDINACKPAGQWQTYDITFRAPRFDRDGRLVEKPRITVYQNGIQIHDNVEIHLEVTTAGIGGPRPKTGPILLQNHGNPVRFRNIWIKPGR